MTRIAPLLFLLSACNSPVAPDTERLMQGAAGAELPEESPTFVQSEITREPLIYCSDTDNLARLKWWADQAWMYANSGNHPDRCTFTTGQETGSGTNYYWTCSGFLQEYRIRIPLVTIAYGHPGTPQNRMLRVAAFSEVFNFSTGNWDSHGQIYCDCTSCWNIVNTPSAPHAVDICYGKFPDGPVTGAPPGAACPGFGCPQ